MTKAPPALRFTNALRSAAVYVVLFAAALAAVAPFGIRTWRRRRALPSWVAHAKRLGFVEMRSSPISVERPRDPRCEIRWLWVTSGPVFHHDESRIQISLDLPLELGCPVTAAVERVEGSAPALLPPWTEVDMKHRLEGRAILDDIRATATALSRSYDLRLDEMRTSHVAGSYTRVMLVCDANVGRDALREAIAGTDRLFASVKDALERQRR